MENKKYQTASSLEKKLRDWIIKGNYKEAIEHSNNEANTRDFLIEPFFDILRYDKMLNYSSEFKVKFPDGKYRYPDMSIKLNRKADPMLLVECKKINTKLSGDPYNQLADYYKHHTKSKIGILTNGIEYEFYSRSLENSKFLHNEPFFVFNLQDFNSYDIEKLAEFDRINIDIDKILENAENKYFLESFNKGLFKTFFKPEKKLVKIIYNNMGLKKNFSDLKYKKIYNLINSVSIEELIEKIKIAESNESDDGIYTSSDEKQAYDRIITLISVGNQIDYDDLKRIGFIDKISFFSIVVDGMIQKKEICRLKLNNNKKELIINKKSYPLKNISPKEFSKHRQKLLDSSLEKLKI